MEFTLNGVLTAKDDTQQRLTVLTKEFEEGSGQALLDCTEGYVIDRVILGYYIEWDGVCHPAHKITVVKEGKKARLSFFDFPEGACTAVALVTEIKEN